MVSSEATHKAEECSMTITVIAITAVAAAAATIAAHKVKQMQPKRVPIPVKRDRPSR